MARIKTLSVLMSILFCSPIPIRADTPLNYPEAYQDLDLPQYAEAVVLSVGRVNNLSDGIGVTLETEATHAELRDYFEAELASRGWILQETIATRKMREAGVLNNMPFLGNFCRDDGTGFQIVATDLGEQRKVDISVTGASAACAVDQ